MTSSAARREDIPFSLEGGAIQFAGTVGRAPVRMMLDSGLAMSFVTPDLRRRLDLPYLGTARLRTPAGVTAGEVAGPLSIRVGGQTVRLPTVVSAPAEMLTNRGIDAEVVLGLDFLRGQRLAIDFASGCLSVPDGAMPLQPAHWSRLDAKIDVLGRLSLEALIPGVGRVPAMVDLGCDAALLMGGSFFAERRLGFGLPVSSGVIGTLAGRFPSIAFSLPSIELDRERIDDVPVDAIPEWDPPQPIILGLPLLSQFKLLFDLPDQAIWIRRIRCEAIVRDFSGTLVAHRGGCLEIIHVASGSPAEAAGISPGSRITQIAGRTVDEAYFTSGLAAWRFGPVGKSVELVCDGEPRMLVLRRYY